MLYRQDLLLAPSCDRLSTDSRKGLKVEQREMEGFQAACQVEDWIKVEEMMESSKAEGYEGILEERATSNFTTWLGWHTARPDQ